MPPSLRGRRAAVAIIFAIIGATFATWATRLPALADHLGLTEGEAGVALFGLALGAFLALPLAGMLAGRWGSRRLTRLGLSISCAALAAIPSATNLAWLTVLLGVFGMGNSGVDVGISVESVETERTYGRPILGGFHALFSLGGLAGGAAGTAAAAAGMAPRLHFSVAAALLLLIGLGTSARFEATPSAERRRFPRRPTRALFLLGAVIFCGFLGEGTMQDWSTLYLRRVTEATAATAAAGLTIFFLAMAIGRTLTDRLVTAFGPARSVQVGGILATAGLVLALAVPSPLPAMVGLGAIGLGLAGVAPIVFSLAGYQPGIPSPEAVATVSTIGYLAFMTGPALIGSMAGWQGLRTALALILAFTTALVMMARFLPRQHPLMAASGSD
jgi:MFS family permease